MAHINSTYYNASAGKLRIVLSAEFFIGTGRDAGFATSGGTRWIIKAIVNGTSTAECDVTGRTVEMTLDYPGNATWAVSTATIQAGSSGGIAASGARKITIGMRLLKR